MIIIFRVAHWNTLDDSPSFGMQEEDIIEHTNGKCHVLTFSMQRDIIEHTHTQILVSAMERQVS